VKARRAAGFTLVEIVIALTIFGLLVLTAYAAFFIGQRAVVSGENKAETNQRLRVVAELIGRQLRSTVFYFARHDEDVVPYFFGAPDRVSFVTSAPQSRGGTGLAVVTYAVIDGKLMLEERIGFTPDTLYVTPEDVRVEHAVLLDGFNALRFEYLALDDPEMQWAPAWDAREEDTLPAGVRIVADGVPFFSSGIWIQEAPLMTIAFGYGTDEFRDPDEELEELEDIDDTAEEDDESFDDEDEDFEADDE
jgi:general secretion pathway protein J